ncbi:MAG: PAS domain S-box protein [Syntrophales bacterium]|nr:PAS domain S-box protein [Syntrophales bacterium]
MKEEHIHRPDTGSRKEEEELYSAIIEHAQAGIGIIQEGHIVFANPYLVKAFGYEEEELLGKTSRQFIHPDDYPSVREKARDMLERRTFTPYEYRLRTKDGGYRWVMEVVNSITFQGKPAILTSTIDVTELKEAERHLSEAKEVLMKTERLAAIGTLAAGVTHEILNPLNIISVYLQMMEDPTVSNGERQKMISVCRRQVERIVKITRDLNQFARVQEQNREELNLIEVLDSVLSLMAVPLRHAQVEVVRHYPELLPIVLADRNAIGQVAVNIISNAIDAMKDREKRRLEISLESLIASREKWVRITFSDSGPGVPPRERDRIFDPFYTTKEVGKGTGMGLAVAYGIVSEHGGKIKVEENEIGGAKFIVELPITE